MNFEACTVMEVLIVLAFTRAPVAYATAPQDFVTVSYRIRGAS